MTTTETPAECRYDKIPDRKPWQTPHFAVLAEINDTSKPYSSVETGPLGPS